MIWWDEWDRWEREGPPPKPPRRRRTDRWQHKARLTLLLISSHAAVWALTNWFAEVNRWMEAHQS